MASPHFPEPPTHQPPTALDAVDLLVKAIAEQKRTWVQTDIPERIALLEGCLETAEKAAPAWVESGCQAKGVTLGTPQEGELWFSGPVVVIRNLRLLIEALEAGGEPEVCDWSQREDGQHVAQVYPASWHEKMFFPDLTAEVWVEPGKPKTQGALYRAKAEETSASPGGLCLVLGAGNISSIGAQDALHKLFHDDEVVILKCNPVNDWAGPHYLKALAPLVEAGLFNVVYGGAEQGAHLTQHPLVDSIHITGSDATHDRIVWGAPDEQAERKAANNPVCSKPIGSELGCVTPVIVVPGDWSDKDLDFQARHVAGMVAHNASFNCNAAKAIVVASGWALKERFLQKVRETLAFTPARRAYYPGAKQRYEAFLENYPKAIPLSEPGDDVVPWTVIPSVPPKKGEYALTSEAFCGVLAEVELEAATTTEFLNKVGAFCNDEVWGTLSCMIIVDAKTEKTNKVAIEQLVGELRYGGIAVNCWAGLVYGLGSTTWGAFPGHTVEKVVSGIGVVHNAFMIDHPQKSVVRGPFRPQMKHIWDPTHKTSHKMGPKVCSFERSPSFFKLVGLAVKAMRA
jgi:hypothetical protein